MSNKINLKFIDDNFPIPGKDNPTQTFRDNFKSIVENFSNVQDAVTDLQINTPRTDTDSNFNSNVASNIVLNRAAFLSFDNGNVDNDIDIDFSNGQFQIVTLTNSVNLSITNWPTNTEFSFLRVALKSDGVPRVANFAARDNQSLKYNSEWPENLVVSSSEDFVIVEFTSFDGGQEIFSRFLGLFLEDKIDTNIFENIVINNDATVNGDLEVEGNLIYSGLQFAEGQDFVVSTNAVIQGSITSDSILTDSITTDEINSTQDPLSINGNLNVNGTISIDQEVFVNNVTANSIGLGANSLAAAANSSGNNIAIGNNSLSSLTTGTNNTSIGWNAGSTVTTGSNNLLLGNSAIASSPQADNEIVLGSENIETFRIPGLDIEITPTGGLKTPHGTTAERPLGKIGTIRFNTSSNTFEGYDGSNWIGLGSVSDLDQDTFLKTELSPGSNEDTFFFTTGGDLSATLSANTFELKPTVSARFKSQAKVTTLGTGALSVDGGVSIDGDLLVAGQIINDATARQNSIVASATSDTQDATQVINVSDATELESFNNGDSIRIFGASLDDSMLTTDGLSVNAQRIGFAEPQESDTTVTFSYRVAQFDLDSGKISPSLQEVNIDIKAVDIDNFNNLNNIQLTLSKQSADFGLLIYRKVGSQLNHRLVAVLGTKDFGASTANLPWTEYYNFDLPFWTSKDETNAYTEQTGLEHFPLTPPVSALQGWVDTTIDSIDSTTGNITVENPIYTENILSVYKDDTPDLQNLIDVNASLNINSLNLQSRNYFVKRLKIPEGFVIAGQGDSTKITKIPWSSRNDSTTNLIFDLDVENNNPTGYSISNLLINGNFHNQYLVNETTDPAVNYAVRCFGNGFNILNVTLENVIGGGYYFYDEDIVSRNIYFNRNRVRRGGLTLRFDHSPFFAQEAEDKITTQNRFQDFTQYVNVNAVVRAVVTNNIISNCGSGLFAFGIISTIVNPNVLLGPAGELLPGPDVLDSEFDSVNITIEPGVDFISPVIVYQESGEIFDLETNQGSLSFAINELRKINGVEVISRDFSETAGGEPYISFDQSVDPSQGQIQFRIQSNLVDDLLSVADFETLFLNNENTQGLIYRIFQTEYVPQTGISGSGSDQGSNIYRIFVDDSSAFSTNDVVRLIDHNTTPTVATEDGTIVNINRITNQIEIEFDFTITDPGSGGQLALKNTFVVVKGKIN